MTALSFALVLLGVLLNAAAQLLLKAGTNSIGQFDFAVANALPIGPGSSVRGFRPGYDTFRKPNPCRRSQPLFG